jgi:hypothetical protein
MGTTSNLSGFGPIPAANDATSTAAAPPAKAVPSSGTGAAVAVARALAPTVDQPASEAEVQPTQSNDTQPVDVLLKVGADGHFYYAITDSKTGKEIQQVPTSQVRDVEDGIEKYLQQTEKTSQKLDAKG